MDILHIAMFALLWLYQEVKADLMIKAPGLELLYTVTDYDHCLVDESRLQLYVGRNIENCITECALRPHCQALTYHQAGTASICEIFQTEGSESDAKQTGCVYIQRNDITISEIPCTPECENDSTCNIVTQSCDRTECTNLPNITNGKILGNLRAVGNKIRFQCDVGLGTEREAVCQPDGKWSVSSVTCVVPEDCRAFYEAGIHDTGVYRIFPLGSTTPGSLVRCDMDTPPGGWTIIQRRVDVSDFYKTWSVYKTGFGDVFGSYWVGNDLIWMLTNQKTNRLRIDLKAQNGTTGYAEYDDFSIEAETSHYALNIGGFYGASSIGDSLTCHNQMQFSTKDMDNEIFEGFNIAELLRGGWWFGGCFHSNLNGDDLNQAINVGLYWFTWMGYFESMKETEMKICPIPNA